MLRLVVAALALILRAANAKTCHAVPGSAATDAWCDANCNVSPPNCPDALCHCDAPPPPKPPVAGPQCSALPAEIPLEQGAVQRQLPDVIKAGYAFISKYYQVREKLVHDITEGNVNVLFHNFAQMQDACFPEYKCTFHGDGKFRIVTTMTPDDMGYGHPYFANVDIFLSDAVAAAKTANKKVSHILSIGGWGWPHVGALCGADDKNGDFQPNQDWISNTAQSYVDSFLALNAEKKAEVNDNDWFAGYDGIDWDLEAIDDNTKLEQMQLTECELMLVHEVTWKMRAKGFIVTMTPPESYFDYGSKEFSRRLDFTAPWTPNDAVVPARYDRESGTPMHGQSPNALPEVKIIPALGAAEEQQNFPYKGKNGYALLVACCPQCYNLIQPQPYEGWSRSGCRLQADVGLDKDGKANFNRPDSVCMMESGAKSSGTTKMYPMEATTLSSVTDVPKAAHYTIKQPDTSAEFRILVDTMQRYLAGWEIDFGDYAASWNLPGRSGSKATVKVRPDQLTMGYGNVPGWVNFLAYKEPAYSPLYQRQHQLMIESFGYKMPYFQPDNIGKAMCTLGKNVRGWVSWNLGWDQDIEDQSAGIQGQPVDAKKYGTETSFEVIIEKTKCDAVRLRGSAAVTLV